MSNRTKTFNAIEYGCPVCKSDNNRRLLNWQDGYGIYKCHDCRLIHTIPLPEIEGLHEFYQGFLWEKPKKNDLNKKVEVKKTELVKLFNLDCSSELSEKTFLDFGGGTGLAARAAVQIGLDVHYLDIDEASRRLVKDEGIVVDNRIFQDIDELNGKTFDFVFSDNVMEHYRDPVNFVQTLYELLKSNGVLVIKTPHAGNTESFFYPVINVQVYIVRALKYNNLKSVICACFHRWWHCDPPRHIYSFSKKSVEFILAKLNISDYEISYYNHSVFDHSIAKVILTKPTHFGIGLLKRAFVLPLLPIELLVQLIHLALLKLKVLSLIGITIKIKKS